MVIKRGDEINIHPVILLKERKKILNKAWDLLALKGDRGKWAIVLPYVFDCFKQSC